VGKNGQLGGSLPLPSTHVGKGEGEQSERLACALRRQVETGDEMGCRVAAQAKVSKSDEPSHVRDPRAKERTDELGVWPKRKQRDRWTCQQASPA
jgi:hypothetical protein